MDDPENMNSSSTNLPASSRILSAQEHTNNENLTTSMQAMVSTTGSTPDPATLFYFSLIEGRCRTQAKENINASRRRDDQALDDDPEVTSLSEYLFSESCRELVKFGLIPKDVIPPDIKELRRYLATFDNRLHDIVTRHSPISFEESAYRAIESNQSYSVSELEGSSIFERSQSQALISQSLMAVPEKVSSSPLRSLMCPIATNGRHQESTYQRKFKEICLLGKGGFGQVFRVRHILDEQEYAVKKIRVSASQLEAIHDEYQFQDLLNELRALAKLQHRNVVRYFDSWLEQRHISSRSMGTRQKLLDNQGYDSRSSETDSSSSSKASLESGFRSLQIGQLEQELKREERRNRINYFQNSAQNSDIVFENSIPSALNTNPPNNVARTSKSTSLFRKPSEMSDEDEDNTEEIERAALDLQAIENEKDWVIFIQMAPYPITLEDYVWSEQQYANSDRLQHCFHIPTTSRILLAILDGVEYIHSHQIVHRDLKPSNIFLSVYTGNSPPEGAIDISSCKDCNNSSTAPHTFITPHIGDFGLIAKLDNCPPVQEPEFFRPSPFAVLSSVASSKQPGTKYYRAPDIESKSGQCICPKLDIYSIGVIAYELLVKFCTKSERHVVLDKLSRGGFEELNGHAMGDGIKGMLCPDREARWDCETVRKWLLDISST